MNHYIDTFPGRKITLKGVSHLYFGGTSYLGLQTDGDFQKLFISNIKKYGTNYGASRKSNIRLSVFDEAETYLAKIVGSEACISLSSGYLAGQFLAQVLNTKEHQFFYAPNTHSALYQSKIKSYTTFATLNIAVREHLESNKSTPVVFLDSIDFSGCNYPDFEALKILPLEDIILVVDDSHGLGIVGKKGGGVYSILAKLKIKELIVCGSLGKGFGIQAGAVFGTKERIHFLTETSFFGGSSPATPAAMATLVEADAIYELKRKRLQRNMDLFFGNLKKRKTFHFMKGHPAYTFSDEQLTEYLEANRIIVTSFPYPDKSSPLMSRIVLSAAHKKKDIEHVLHCINILP
ncbi:aminotransferase class I/II-fold pyridoxal phosphate-dependent enzyme [Zobellia barbeyronii]|uniref:Aminotransferase class I/II-fold pyridoxal phosphate-dependent enzyme n=1 Tax=Zobellia barbeyronii TaxID=2748009 RepID=A0ABS5WDM1_9FLAO|nr:aminotransferase class I/II-fold pyridoxal phosphate-dependent enzyme [Zobellia barbeyronii]MBT2161180.1 aminotransferase class I/II-fold pyridoxal phosphate-dependent enzyme [Zobellia barbeyronii]